MSQATDSPTGRDSRGSDATTELLLGVYRDVQQHSARLSEQTRDLAALRAQVSTTALEHAQHLLALREEVEASLGRRAREATLALAGARAEDSKVLEELRERVAAGVLAGERALSGLAVRVAALERSTHELVSDVQHERARLSELRADLEGQQDKVVRSAVVASVASAKARRALWLAALAILLALGTLGLGLWPTLRGLL